MVPSHRREAYAQDGEGRGHVVVGVVRQEGSASWGEGPSEGEDRDHRDAACGNQSLPVWAWVRVAPCDGEGGVVRDGAYASWEDGEREEELWVELDEERVQGIY